MFGPPSGAQPSLGMSRWLEPQSEGCAVTPAYEPHCYDEEPTSGPRANRLLLAPFLPVCCLGIATTPLPKQHRGPWFVRNGGVYLDTALLPNDLLVTGSAAHVQMCE